jgi:superfamily I DNA/RNA helicase
MKLPKLDDLIDEQSVVYDHRPNEHLFVVGPPGSGKTSLAVLRARFLGDLGQTVALVTRNRMLASLARQLGNENLDARTMSEFVAGTFYKDHNRFVPQISPYVYNWVDIVSAYGPLKGQKKLDHLVIDEAQNLPSDFLRWAFRYSARTLTVFADEDQTTYPLRSSLRDICDAGMPNPIRLAANHRNTVEIAAVAEHFHRSQILPPGVVRRPRGGEAPQLISIGKEREIIELVAARYSNRGEAIGIITHFKADVTRIKLMLDAVMPVGSRVDAYTSSMPEVSDAIKLLTPGVTVLTSESVIGLEFDAVYLCNLTAALPCLSLDASRRMYMLCARARDKLVLVNGPTPLSDVQLADLPPTRLLPR